LFGLEAVVKRLWWVVVVAAIAAIAALVVIASRPGAGGGETAAIGGPFHLVDQRGHPVDQHILDGKWTAVFFGYTYCPDVCPTTLAALGRTVEALGPAARKFQVVFITVDPERDTPRALGAYLASPTFPPGAIGLTGQPAQIAQAALAYRVLYQKHRDGDSYTMDHSAVVYLMDPRGRFVKPLDLSASPADAARQVTQAMAAS
jgi:protein SCO1/2